MPGTRWTAATVAVAGALALVGCSSDSGGSAPGPTTTVTETVTTTVTATPTASEASASASSSASASPTSTACRARSLNVKIVPLDSGAGQRYASVVLTNSSSRSCTVTGYPGLALFASGKAVPTRVVRVTSPSPATVALKPGGQASSAINFGVVATGSESTSGPCEPAPTSALVTPPDSTTAIATPWTLGSVCNRGRISAKAFVAGNGG